MQFLDPTSLEDWYSFANAEALEKLTDDVQAGKATLSGAALARVSAANSFADITDYFFGLRQSSPISPKTMVASANDNIINNNELRGLEKFGVMVLISDLERLAGQIKIECLQKSLENITTYLGMTPQRKHLFQYDCFVGKMAGGWAATGAARIVSPELINYALTSIDDGKKNLYRYLPS